MNEGRQGSKPQRRRARPAVRFGGEIDAAANPPSEVLAIKRAAIANFCRTVGEQLSGKTSTPPAPINDQLEGLSPRVRQTLGRLLAGDSEKQIGIHMAVSRHTVHVYVKTLYRRFHVSSRGELLARFVNQNVEKSSKV
jgi:DNA-binding CsgD family transcriptional regulator